MLAPWSQLQQALSAVAEGDDADPQLGKQLADLGLASNEGGTWRLTQAGDRYYLAMFVAEDSEAAREALGDVLQGHPIASGFCEAGWALGGEVPKAGAVRLMKRLLQSGETDAKRWLALLNSAGLIAYNRANPAVRISWSPESLGNEHASHDLRAHVVSPETPFQNLLSLREVIGSARDWLCWFEIHMPAKVLQVLQGELAPGQVREVLLLSGPANVSRRLQGDFKRARQEWSAQRGISVEWRVIEKKESRELHDRLFLSRSVAYNLPPLNTVLKGSKSEMLPSKLTRADFDAWWNRGVDLLSFQPDE